MAELGKRNANVPPAVAPLRPPSGEKAKRPPSGERAGRPPSGERQGSGSNPTMAKLERTSGPKQGPQDVKGRLREGSINVVLNAASILAEVWDDFRNQDRFFKYKAGIIAAWLLLSGTAFFVAFPRSASEVNNSLGARLVVAGDASRPVYMIKNESKDEWKEVTVIANGKFRTAIGKVEGNGGSLTFIPKQLKGDRDSSAPADLRITDLQLKTDDGSTWLIKNGEPR